MQSNGDSLGFHVSLLFSIKSRASFDKMCFVQDYHLFLKEQFTSADKSKNGFLFQYELSTLLKNLSVEIKKEDIAKVLEDANTLVINKKQNKKIFVNRCLVSRHSVKQVSSNSFTILQKEKI